MLLIFCHNHRITITVTITENLLSEHLTITNVLTRLKVWLNQFKSFGRLIISESYLVSCGVLEVQNPLFVFFCMEYIAEIPLPPHDWRECAK